MKTGWQTKKMKDLCVIKPPKNEARKILAVNEFVSFVPMEDLGIFTKKINVSKERKLSDVVGSYTYFADGDVLMAKITPCFENGKLGIAQNLKNGIGFGSSEFVVFRPKSEINPSYLYYLLTSDKFREEGRIKMSGAVGHKRVPKEYIENFEVLLPSITEQKRIVKILDEAFLKIAEAKENAEKNLQNSKELFDSFLMDIFSKLDCSTVLKDTAGVIGGFSFKSTDFLKHGKYQVIRMGNVRPGIIRKNENPVFIDDIDQVVLKRALLRRNDVIITQTGTKNKRDYGFTAIINEEKYLLNQRISAIRFRENYLPDFFLYYSWTKLFKDQYFANETGTVGQGNVGIGAIANALIPSLSLSEQKKIVKEINLLCEQTKKLEANYKQKIADLEELKKSLLTKAFAGEL